MTLAIRSQPKPLDGRRAISRQRKHLLPREREFDRAVGHRLGGERGQHHVGVRRAFGPEAAADMRRDHAHALRRQSQQRRHRRSHGMHALRGVVEREPAAAPDRDRGVRLHGIVVLGRRAVGLVHGDSGRRQRLLDVTLVGVGLEIRIDRIG